MQHHLREHCKITCVQGSAIADQLSNKRQEVVEDQRQLIKTQIRVGWSAEAVKQGITHAKKGDNDSAISCYKKVRSHSAALQYCIMQAGSACKQHTSLPSSFFLSAVPPKLVAWTVTQHSLQALDLNRRNVDAWVARGAAYANQHAFPKAISDLQTALGKACIEHHPYLQ